MDEWHCQICQSTSLTKVSDDRYRCDACGQLHQQHHYDCWDGEYEISCTALWKTEEEEDNA